MSENPEYLFWYPGFLYFGKEAVMTNQDYMKRALELAKKAMGYTSPNPMVGCVVVKDGRIVTEGYHERCGEYHAERNALTKCSEDLTGATMYVTLEPCQMCAGAIVQARIPRVVIGSMNSKAGCAGSIINLLNMPQFNHQAEVVRGVCDEECSTMLSTFFRELRQKKKAEKEAGKEALKETPASQNIRI